MLQHRRAIPYLSVVLVDGTALARFFLLPSKEIVVLRVFLAVFPQCTIAQLSLLEFVLFAQLLARLMAAPILLDLGRRPVMLVGPDLLAFLVGHLDHRLGRPGVPAR